MTDERRAARDRRRVTRSGRRSSDPQPLEQSMSRRRLATILLVDQSLADSYAVGLDAAGYGVVTAAATNAAVTASHSRPDVIVLDPAEPAPPGSWHVCAELQRTCPHIPVIVVTTAVPPERASESSLRTLTNCVAYVAKPCDSVNLASVIERVRIELVERLR